MAILSGWNLTGRLVLRHFGALGDTVASLIASFDPETATEADRDRLSATLREVSSKYSQAKREYDKEHNDVVVLQQDIAAYENQAAELARRLAAGEPGIDEATAALFCDEMEAAKGRLSTEVAEADQAEAYMKEIKAVMDEFSQRLAAFDSQANKARRDLAAAQAQLKLQQTRAEQQEELRALSGKGGVSSGMSALQQRAAKMRDQAEGLRTVTDLGNKPAADQARLASLRQSLSSGTSAAPTALERLRALSAEKPAAAAA